ncbi:hypothetical protein HYR69_08590, partial [Candidatus Sumerlaeota bacterium]|nr:hypothetical protein [Candidatus Sumerlaeota bacterium]
MFWRKTETSIEEKARPTRENTPHVAWRLWFLALAGLLLLGGFAVRIYYLTVLMNPYFYELSENNYMHEQPVSAPRGKIMTADGASVALNRTLYDIEMGPFGLNKEDIAKTVNRLAELLGRPELAKKAQAVIDLRHKWKRIPLARDLDLQEVTPVLERAYQLPGVVIEPQYSRHYPFGPLFAHVTGYVGAIDDKQLKSYLNDGYLRADLIGKIGAERQFEDMLRGTHGTELVIRDAHGRPRSSRIEEPASRGNDIVLTLDLRLQAMTDALMKDRLGVAVVMDPRDGSILALVSKPDYDPNDPRKGAASGETSSFNKVIRGKFAPASTFKLVTASAGLLQGRYPDEKIFCGGRFLLPSFKRPFYCDVRWGHGTLDLYEAIQKSCNVYFYTWADQLGYDRIIETAHGYGFGLPTGIDLTPEGLETAGRLGRRGKDAIYRGSVIQMGIGQGALVAVTPIQLICAYAALGNHGKRARPHIFKEERSPVGETI